MKTKVMIIEDNCYKFFTIKQVLEAQLKLAIRVIDVKTGKELALAAASVQPDQILYRPSGGVAELLEKFQKRRVNRRNTEITIVLATDLDEVTTSKLEEFASQKRYPQAA